MVIELLGYALPAVFALVLFVVPLAALAPALALAAWIDHRCGTRRGAKPSRARARRRDFQLAA